jgi:RNA polymerase sigma-70 factor, ECF subfamily
VREANLRFSADDSANTDPKTEMEQLAAAGRAAWPDLAIDPAVFVAHARARLDPNASAASVAQLQAADLYLACGCARGLPPALAAFEAQIMPEARDALRRLRLQPAALDDLLQSVRTRVLVDSEGRGPKIADYSGRGGLRSWIRVVATRTALNVLRGNRLEVLSEDILLTAAAQSSDSPELVFLKQRHGRALRAAFQRAVDSLKPDQRELLRRYYLEGLTAEQIGRLTRRHRITVTRRIDRTLQTLRRRTLQLLERDFGCDRTAAESIVGAALSQVTSSLHRYLGSPEVSGVAGRASR